MKGKVWFLMLIIIVASLFLSCSSLTKEEESSDSNSGDNNVIEEENGIVLKDRVGTYVGETLLNDLKMNFTLKLETTGKLTIELERTESGIVSNEVINYSFTDEDMMSTKTQFNIDSNYSLEISSETTIKITDTAYDIKTILNKE